MLASLSNARLTRRSLLRYAAVGGVLAGVGPLAAACGGTSETTTSPSASAAPKKGGSLRVGIVGGGAQDTLDGQNATTEPQICTTFQLYRRAARLGCRLQDRAATRRRMVAPTPTPASGPSSCATGVVFHDGKPVTADDVVYSYRAHHRPEGPEDAAPASSPMLPPSGIQKVERRRSSSISTSRTPSSTRRWRYYSNCIVPVGFDPKNPIGTGPFKVKSFDSPASRYVFDANPNYWGDGPVRRQAHHDRVRRRHGTLNALLGGSVEAISQLPSAQVKVIEGQGLKRAQGQDRRLAARSPCASTRSRSTTCACARPSGSSSTASR